MWREEHESEFSLGYTGYTAKPCLVNKNKQTFVLAYSYFWQVTCEMLLVSC